MINFMIGYIIGGIVSVFIIAIIVGGSLSER